MYPIFPGYSRALLWDSPYHSVAHVPGNEVVGVYLSGIFSGIIEELLVINTYIRLFKLPEAKCITGPSVYPQYNIWKACLPCGALDRCL